MSRGCRVNETTFIILCWEGRNRCVLDVCKNWKGCSCFSNTTLKQLSSISVCIFYQMKFIRKAFEYATKNLLTFVTSVLFFINTFWAGLLLLHPMQKQTQPRALHTYTHTHAGTLWVKEVWKPTVLDHVAGAICAHAAQHMSPWLQVSSYNDVRSSARWLKLLASHQAAAPNSQRRQGAVSIKKVCVCSMRWWSVCFRWPPEVCPIC